MDFACSHLSDLFISTQMRLKYKSLIWQFFECYLLVNFSYKEAVIKYVLGKGENKVIQLLASKQLFIPFILILHFYSTLPFQKQLF